MNYPENESAPQGIPIYRDLVTSRYKKYRGPVLVGLRGISDGIVTGMILRSFNLYSLIQFSIV
jgi:hypothetical protein